jgi:DNA-binding NarL/FixJ family response regulator
MAPISVLLVDDNAFFLSLAVRFLASQGELRLAGSASSAADALDKAQSMRPDVILLDLNLPEISGLDLIPRLRGLIPRVKIIVLTLWEADGYRQAALSAGADEFVSKSRVNTHLVPAIRRVTAPLTELGMAN